MNEPRRHAFALRQMAIFGADAGLHVAAAMNDAADFLERLAPTSTEPVTLTYTNWRGETAARTLIPLYVWFGSTEWHPEPQWLLRATDIDKGAERDFALKDFGAPAALAKFAKECLAASWGGWDLDGGDVQDTAERLGIIQSVTFDPAIHHDPEGLTEAGEKWFVFSPAVAACLDNGKKKDQP